MNVSVIGMSHRTAPVEVREKLSLPGDLPARLLRAARAEGAVEEAILLDTCNRTELYFVARNRDNARGWFLDLIGRVKGKAVDADPSCLVRLDGVDAVRHLFRVSAALDSQIVGEHQILGQVKAAYRLAVHERTSHFLLNRLLHAAFRVGKRCRTETGLSRGAVSVAHAAVALASRIFSDIRGKTALLVGAGEMAEAAARALMAQGVSRLVVANRTLSRAQQLADDLARGRSAGPEAPDADDADGEEITCPALLAMLGGLPPRQAAAAPAPVTRAVEIADIPAVIDEADMVICSTGSPEPVLEAAQLGEALRRRRRFLFIVDIAVPRDVDPALGDFPNVFLYNMNDLDQVVARNLQRRREEIPAAEAIVDDEVLQFIRWHDSLQMASTIKLLKQRFAMRQQAEIERYGRLFHADDRDQLGQFAQGLCNKLLHQPIAFLKGLTEDATASDQLMAVATIRKMFELDSLEEDS